MTLKKRKKKKKKPHYQMDEGCGCEVKYPIGKKVTTSNKAEVNEQKSNFNSAYKITN